MSQVGHSIGPLSLGFVAKEQLQTANKFADLDANPG